MDDSKKITRRVAPGAAVGGVAAANAIVFSLKQRYQVPEPLSDFGPDWNECVRQLDLPITDIDGPSRFTLTFSPPLGEKLRVVSLTGHYESGNYPQVPVAFREMEGTVTVVPPIEDHEPTLLVRANEGKHGVRNRRQRHDSGEVIAVPAKTDVKFFQRGGNSYKEISAGSVPFPCYEVAMAFGVHYPAGKGLAKGQKWIISDAPNLVELPFTVVGFAMVNGRKTAKMLASKQLNNREFLQRMIVLNEKAKEVEKARSGSVDAMALQQRQLLHLQSEKDRETGSWKLTSFVDLETGTPVRQELAITVSKGNGELSSLTSIIRHVFYA